MNIQEAMKLTSEQFNIRIYKQKHNHGEAIHDDSTRYSKIINLLKKINLPADFTLIDLGCGHAGVLQEMRTTFPQSNLYGVDVYPSESAKAYHDAGICEIYNLDFMKLPELDFKCDVALMLNLYHHPGTFGITNSDQDVKTKEFLKKLEELISARFKYWITTLNPEQYLSFKNRTSHYSNIPAMIIQESSTPQIQGDHPMNDIPEFVVIHLGDK
jgi:SAM-dependent methyltransferase